MESSQPQHPPRDTVACGGANILRKRFALPVGPVPGQRYFSGQVDVFPSERRDVGQEFGRDLVPVGVVRAELGALVGIEAALEQRPEDRRVDLRSSGSAPPPLNSPPLNQATASMGPCDGFEALVPPGDAVLDG